MSPSLNNSRGVIHVPIFHPTDEQKTRRRKILKWALVVGAAVGGLILVIALLK